MPAEMQARDGPGAGGLLVFEFGDRSQAEGWQGIELLAGLGNCKWPDSAKAPGPLGEDLRWQELPGANWIC